MSRKLLTFLLSELTTVRIICKAPGCGAVAEVSLEQMRVFFKNPRCSICGQPLIVADPVAGQRNGFTELGEAVLLLKSNLNRADVEFVLPDTTP